MKTLKEFLTEREIKGTKVEPINLTELNDIIGLDFVKKDDSFVSEVNSVYDKARFINFFVINSNLLSSHLDSFGLNKVSILHKKAYCDILNISDEEFDITSDKCEKAETKAYYSIMLEDMIDKMKQSTIIEPKDFYYNKFKIILTHEEALYIQQHKTLQKDLIIDANESKYTEDYLINNPEFKKMMIGFYSIY